MGTFFAIASSFISVFCTIALFLLLIRAIFSWFPGQGGAFEQVIYSFTEPLLIPVRKLFDLLNIRPNLPLDISFTVTCVLLVIIRMMVS